MRKGILYNRKEHKIGESTGPLTASLPKAHRKPLAPAERRPASAQIWNILKNALPIPPASSTEIFRTTFDNERNSTGSPECRSYNRNKNCSVLRSQRKNIEKRSFFLEDSVGSRQHKREINHRIHKIRVPHRRIYSPERKTHTTVRPEAPENVFPLSESKNTRTPIPPDKLSADQQCIKFIHPFRFRHKDGEQIQWIP